MAIAGSAPKIIDVREVSKEFVTRKGPLAVLNRISLQAAEREFVSIVGPSGCGKSTLLRIIADLTPPSGGTLLVRGKSPVQARLDRAVSFVFQDACLLPWRTVRRNIELPLEASRIPTSERHVVAKSLIDLVGLREFADAYPRTLSGGMKQRVAIARALATKPRLLLMDEPFGALDEITREKMNYELLRIFEVQAVSVIFVTHNIGEAVLLADRVVVMSARPGRILGELSISFGRPRSPEVRTSQEFFELTRRCWEHLRQGWGGEQEDQEPE